MPNKPIFAVNDETGERMQLVNNQWVPAAPVSTVPKMDPNTFLDARASMEDLDQLKGQANWGNTGTVGWATRKIGGLPAYNFEGRIKPIMNRGMIAKMLQMKAASTTGATGFGQLSEAEGDALRSTLGNLDTGQSTDQFEEQLARARQLMNRIYPGLTPETPIDLSKGQSREDIPREAYYKDKWGNIRINKNGDSGNPKWLDKTKPIAKQVTKKTNGGFEILNTRD